MNNDGMYGLLGPVDQRDAITQGLLGLGAGLLQASGPSAVPTSLGGAIGRGASQGFGAYQGAMNNSLNRNLTLADLHSRMQDRELVRAQTAQKIKDREEQRARQAAYRNTLPPEQQGLFDVNPEAFTTAMAEQYKPTDPRDTLKQFGDYLYDVSDPENPTPIASVKINKPGDRYTPVSGVGMWDAVEKKLISPDAQIDSQPDNVPQYISNMPGPAIDPMMRLGPKERDKGLRARLETDYKTLADIEQNAEDLGSMASSAERFVNIMDQGVETGGVMTRMPGYETFSSATDAAKAEMYSIRDKLTPLMRQGMPGAASDRDVKMFQSATIGPEKPEETNRNIALGMISAAQNKQEELRFKEAYYQKNGSLIGADKYWQDYLRDNPIFAGDTSSYALNQNRMRWEDYIANREYERERPRSALVAGSPELPPGFVAVE
ncbi:MAG TPA: hypothetical protein DD397_06725 [Hyphomonas sp.]|jgi:hypothetical protein|uniref:hypothetical protein n=1 Tax=Hyphomonas sp. TaxID=87 RepID=UPI000E968584|nr:hypothetical protein [Hyphomonas sp.]QDP49092.1 MAG: hypothetical protein Unbinned4811contig1001_37 [Prokaryotic dsDNA virus sp.]HBN92239.1 hypothetical protein [Hyphomonas sp.]|tara:strand:+ start:21178 stop:22479 length:1302 start_codon:yes stop_codon:yes gene_type:complete